MAHLGHPLAIDPLYYPGRNAEGLFLSTFKRGYRPSKGEQERPLIERLPLHAEKLAFTDLNGERVELVAPPPKDMRAAINMLSRHG